MRRAVVLLGVVATVCVLVASALAVHDARHADRLWLRAHGWELAVPVGRWRLEPASRAIRYDDHALVRGPAVLDEGFCPSAAGSSRAFVGILPPQPGEVAAVVARTATTWAAGVRGRPVPAVAGEGSRADLEVAVPTGACSPVSAHVTVVGRRSAGGVVAVVLVRDVGEPDDLSAADAGAVLATLRPAG